MIRQIPFTEHEAVLLLDAYLQTISSDCPRLHIVRKTSEDLRKMAINNGYAIDDIYRNVNGISFQIASMESAYKGHTVSIPSSRLFTDVIELYKRDKAKYLNLLQEAKTMVDGSKSIVEQYTIWISTKVSPKHQSELNYCYHEIEEYCRKIQILKQPLFETTDLSTVKKVQKAVTEDRLFQLQHKKQMKMIVSAAQYYTAFIKELNEKHESEKQAIESKSTIQEVEPTLSKSVESSMVQLESFEIDEAIRDEIDRTLQLKYPILFRKIFTALVNHNEPVSIENIQKEIGIHFRTKDIYSVLMQASWSKECIGNNFLYSKESSAHQNNEILSVLKQHYEYGFKYNSIRELMRFRQFADGMGVSLPSDDDELKASILSAGTVIEDKVYCKSDDMPKELQRIVDEIFSSGVGVIYYESLFENEQSWMESHVITSADMLKEYMQQNIVGCSFSKKFMVKGTRIPEKEAVTDELRRVWGTSPSVSVYELQNRLPNIPLGNIWRVISGNDLFVLNSEGEYLLIDLFRITEDEKEDILDFVEGACEEQGFASLTDVPLGGIEEENYELTQLAIYNAIYKKVLSGKYHINGKILTKEKSELDAVALLKQYIKGKDECSFDEVANKVVELTGGSNRQYAFQALYDDMVRVEKNRFVANRLVSFNVDEIDAALSGFITDNFRAIRDVTTFAMFPLCGQSWNHYLLESFCYKYSKKFSLHVIHFNDKNAGIIAEKDYNKAYTEMLAIALAKSDVELTADTTGQYLFNTGYMAKSKYAKLNEIAQRASELRKER